MLPKDPFILLSYVNTKLRDEYSSLDELCSAVQADKEELISRLSAVNYSYDEKTNQFT